MVRVRVRVKVRVRVRGWRPASGDEVGLLDLVRV